MKNTKAHSSKRVLALTPLAIAAGLVCQLAWAQEQNSVVIDTGINQAETTLAPIEVVGRRASDAYYADEASGTKTDLPLREVPQAVRVMSRQTLDDLGAVRVDDVMDFVGGVSRQSNFGGLWDNIAIRGMAGDVNNGMPLLLNGFSGNRGFNAPRDTANVERIEFLKGPAASLYGTSEPGGTVNIVTKQPLWRAGHSIETYVGSHDFYRAAFDSTGPINDSLAYRLNVAVEDRGSFRDYIKTKRYLVAPALTWKATADTTVRYSAEVLHHETPLDRGVTAVNGQLGAIPRERFLGEPADGNVSVDNQTHQLIVDHLINDEWSARAGLSYKKGSIEGFSTEPHALQNDQRTMWRQRRFRDYATDDIAIQGELTRRFQAAGIGHELLMGAEAYWFEYDQLMLRANPTGGAPYAIDIFNPVYGQAQPVPGPNTNSKEKQRNTALYIQDTLSLGEKWRVMGGLRFDRYDQSVHNYRTGVITNQSPTATSPRIGVSYLVDEQWTLFANTGKSFRPNNGVDANGQPYSPESGRAFEVGTKWENANKTLGATLAVFDIRKKNVLTPDPANAGFSIAAGEVESRGIDADISGQLSRHWRVNASLSFIDASVKRDNSLESGGRLLNIPRVNGSVLLMHETMIADGQRLGLGGGLTYSGKRLGEARTQAQANSGAATFDLPAYTVAKAAAYWIVNPSLRFSLDIDNLFDRTYYTSSFQRTWVTPGAPRTVMLGMQAKF